MVFRIMLRHLEMVYCMIMAKWLYIIAYYVIIIDDSTSKTNSKYDLWEGCDLYGEVNT